MRIPARSVRFGCLSGKDSSLLDCPPLRTVHTGFPVHRSSLYKPFLREPASQLCNCRWQFGCNKTRLDNSSPPPITFFTLWCTFQPVSWVMRCRHIGHREPCDSSRQPDGCGLSWSAITVIKTGNVIVFQVVIWPVQLNPVNVAYFHERRSLNNFHRDRVITFEQIAE